MRSLPEGLISRREALADGWTDSALHRAVRSGRLTRVRRGYFLAGPAGVDEAAQAVTASCPAAVISHRSAARVYGMPLIGRPPTLPEVTMSPRAPGSLVDAHLYRATLDADDVVTIGTMRVTSPARTVVDLGRHLPLFAAVAAGDFALHEGLVTAVELAEVAQRCANWPGIGRARAALAQLDGRAESPLESVSRLVLVRSPLLKPEPQQWIADQRGVPVARVDFGWAEYGVVGESDGMTKYTGPEVLTAEKERQERLEQLGLIVVRWGWSDVWKRPEWLVARVTAALDRATRSALPRLWSILPS